MSGELWLLASMVSWTIVLVQTHIATQTHDGVSLLLVSYIVCFLIALIFALSLHPEAFVYPYTTISENWLSMVIAGGTSAMGAFFFTLAFKVVPPALGSVILAMDSFVTALIGYWFLNEVLTGLEMLGELLAVIVFTLV